MNSQDHRYVAHFDILGMGDLALRDQERAWNMLSDFYHVKEDKLNKTIQLTATNETIRDQIARVSFSDSIVIFTKGDSDKDLYAIVILCAELFAQSLHKCIPLRGGIAHGRFFFNVDYELFFGPPLVIAHRLGEEAQWLGIVVDSYVAQRSQEVGIKSRNQPAVIEWNVPLKNRRVEKRYVINWPSIFSDNWHVEFPISVEQFYVAFENDFGKFSKLDESVQRKYENTVEFVNERMQLLKSVH